MNFYDVKQNQATLNQPRTLHKLSGSGTAVTAGSGTPVTRPTVKLPV